MLSLITQIDSQFFIFFLNLIMELRRITRKSLLKLREKSYERFSYVYFHISSTSHGSHRCRKWKECRQRDSLNIRIDYMWQWDIKSCKINNFYPCNIFTISLLLFWEKLNIFDSTISLTISFVVFFLVRDEIFYSW